MKHLLLTIIAAVVLVGCAKPPPPDISIHEAAKKGNIEAVKQHLAVGTDVDAKDYGWSLPPLVEMTPLHFAALKDHKEIVELLIAAGADVNAKNKNGYTPLDMADDVEGIGTPPQTRRQTWDNSWCGCRW